MGEEREIDPELLLWARVEGQEDQLHCFMLAHVPGGGPHVRLLAYATLCGSRERLVMKRFKGELKCEVCERARRSMNVITLE